MVIISSWCLSPHDLYWTLMFVPVQTGWWGVPLIPAVWHSGGAFWWRGPAVPPPPVCLWWTCWGLSKGTRGVMRCCHWRAEVNLFIYILLPACHYTQIGCWGTNLDLQLTLHLPWLACRPVSMGTGARLPRVRAGKRSTNSLSVILLNQ